MDQDFAEVAVQIAPAPHHEVVVCDEVFSWLRDVYGSDARLDGPYEDELCAEASEGVWYALRRLPSDLVPVRVTVIKIRVSAADTGRGDVKFAAVHAVWQALDHDPGARPWLSQDGDPVFPDQGPPQVS